MDAYCFKHPHNRIYIWSCSNHSHKCYDRKIYRIPFAGFIGFLAVEGTICKKMVQYSEITGYGSARSMLNCSINQAACCLVAYERNPSGIIP